MAIAPAGQVPRRLRASGQQILGADGVVSGGIVVMHDVMAGLAAESTHAG